MSWGSQWKHVGVGVGWGPWRASPALTWWLLLGSIKQLHERVTQECAEYRALYEKMVLPPDVGPRVDWARVLEQKQVRGTRVSTPSPGAQSHTRCSQRARQNVFTGALSLNPGLARGPRGVASRKTVQPGKALRGGRTWLGHSEEGGPPTPEGTEPPAGRSGVDGQWSYQATGH